MIEQGGNVLQFPDRGGPVDNGGGPPPPPDMEPRLRTLEQGLARLDAQLSAVLPTLPTKADLSDLRSEIHKGTTDLTRWIVGTSLAMTAAAVTIMTFVLNNATPRTSANPVASPSVIVVPGGAIAPSPPSAPVQAGTKPKS